MEKHLVNRLSFEIRCPSEDQAIGLRHNFAQTLQSQMEAGIDKVCSKYSNEYESIRINKLELDLGQFNSHTFESHLVEVFLDKFERAILHEQAKILSIEGARSLHKSQLESLVYFLETGQLTWWETEKQPNLNQWFLDHLTESGGTLLRFLNSVSSNTYVWQRIAVQFSPEVHNELIRHIQRLDKLVEELMRQVKEVSQVCRIGVNPEITPFLNQLVIGNAIHLTTNTPDSGFVLKLLVENVMHIFEAISAQDEVSIAQTIKALDQEIASVFKHIESQNGMGKESIKPELFKEEIVNIQMSQVLDPETPSKTKPNKEKYLSGHGGAVLLAPFFKPFFTNLGLLDEQQWKNRVCQFKAVHLINYLCTGESNSAEYNLNLEKLLCGLPIHAPVSLVSKLTQDEKQEANALLESVIEHWAALKSTSVDGLRQAFLLRDCILTKKDSNWKIHMERKTIDVLLEKIPWGYSIIFLPWNQYQIHVEW